MTDKNYTHVTIVVDRSGSMMSIQADAEGGINSLIKEQKLVDGKMTLTLAEFDDVYNIVYDAADIQEVEGYRLSPRGSTALLDAVGRSINSTGKALKALPEDERPGNVIFVIVTDGHENASREFTGDQIKKMVDEQTDKYDWEFVFIGANVDAFTTGAALGFRGTVQYQATGQSTNAVYGAANTALTNSRAFGTKLIDNMEDSY